MVESWKSLPPPREIRIPWWQVIFWVGVLVAIGVIVSMIFMIDGEIMEQTPTINGEPCERVERNTWVCSP